MFLIFKFYKILFLVIIFQVFQVGCASTPSKMETNLYVSSVPSGANITLTVLGKNKQQYTSPAEINITGGNNYLKIFKEGYWDEERLFRGTWGTTYTTTGSRVGGLLAGGIVGGLLSPPSTISNDKIEWDMYDQTKMNMDTVEGKPLGGLGMYDYIIGVISENNKIQIKLVPISPVLIRLFASIENEPKKRLNEVNLELDKLYKEKNINKEEFLRAKYRAHNLYYKESSEK